jgi:exodeoxyribonuclease VII small subunit
MKKERFEDYLAAVEGSVQKLESGDLALEEALAQYEEGVKALRRCEEILAAAEKKVEILTKGGALEPFEVQKTEDAEREQRKARKSKPPQDEEGQNLFGKT